MSKRAGFVKLALAACLAVAMLVAVPATSWAGTTESGTLAVTSATMFHFADSPDIKYEVASVPAGVQLTSLDNAKVTIKITFVDTPAGFGKKQLYMHEDAEPGTYKVRIVEIAKTE